MTYSNQRHCRNCNSFGHTAQQCPTKPSPQWSTAALSTAAKKLGEPHQYHSPNYFSSSFSCFLFCVPIAFNDTKITALVDTVAFSSAITPHFISFIESKSPTAILSKSAEKTKVKDDNGNIVSTLGKVELSFFLGGQIFTESFLILPRMNRPILGLPLFERNNITLHPKTRTLSLPDMTLQPNETSSPTGNIKKTYSKKKFYLKTTEKLVIRPNCQEVSSCQLTSDDLPIGTNAIVEMLPNFERKTGLCLTDSIGCLDQNVKLP